MKKQLSYCILAMAAMLLAACERRPLYDDLGGNVYLEIDIETEVVRGQVAGMNVSFFDTETHQRLAQNFVSYNGGYINVIPNDYDIVVYNYDTEYTMLRNETEMLEAEAYTNIVPANIRRNFETLMKAMAAARNEESRTYATNPVVNQPDHLYVGHLDGVKVPYSLSDDDVLHLYVKAKSIVDVYRLYINNVLGMRYIRTAEAYVTGQASSMHIFDKELTGGPVTLYVPLEASSETQLTSTFNTFGKYKEPTYVVLRVTDLADKVYTWEWDVTDQFNSGSHVIVVNQEIRIEPTDDSGGFGPELQEWSDIVTNINM